MAKKLFEFCVLAVLLAFSWAVGMYSLLRPAPATPSLCDGSSECEDATLLDPDGPPSQTDLPQWQKDYSSLSHSFGTMMAVALAKFDLNFEGADYSNEAHAMFTTFVILITVLMLNLLIAVLSAEHARVDDDISKEFAFTQASTILRLQERINTNASTLLQQSLRLSLSLCVCVCCSLTRTATAFRHCRCRSTSFNCRALRGVN
jgi:hypothetical protein